MTLLEKLLSITQSELIITHGYVPQAFIKLAEDQSLDRLKSVKQTLEALPDDIFSKYVLKPNIVCFLDAIIKIIQEDGDYIADLQSENRHLRRNNARLRRAIKERPATTKHLLLDGHSSKCLKDAMTIPMTIHRRSDKKNCE